MLWPPWGTSPRRSSGSATCSPCSSSARGRSGPGCCRWWDIPPCIVPSRESGRGCCPGVRGRSSSADTCRGPLRGAIGWSWSASTGPVPAVRSRLCSTGPAGDGACLRRPGRGSSDTADLGTIAESELARIPEQVQLVTRGDLRRQTQRRPDGTGRIAVLGRPLKVGSYSHLVMSPAFLL